MKRPNPKLVGSGLARTFQAEALHFFVERRAVDAEGFGCGVAVPVVTLEHVQNDLPLGIR
jgi:hypothetical protein